MNKPIIVSFYTPNYQEEYERMVKSLRQFDFQYNVVKVPSMGQWIDNVYYRADFVLMMMEKYEQDIVWIDVDAELLRYPKLFLDFPGDFGAHFWAWPSGKRELLGGTIYFKYNCRCLEMVYKWVNLNQERPKKKRSQIVLQKAVEQSFVRMTEFPAEYTYIPRFMPEVTEPVILHHQASGKYRRADLEGFDVEEVTTEPD